MTQQNIKRQEVFLAVDCEFSKDGKVRELTLLLFKHTRLVKALEVCVSKNGKPTLTYTPQVINYHIRKNSDINPLVDAFLTSCKIYCPIEKIRLVGIGVSQDVKLVHKTSGGNTLLSSMRATTDLEFCGRGRLQDKVQDHNISSEQLTDFISKIVGPQNASSFTYHTSMYDAVATAYVYCRLKDPACVLVASSEVKSSKYTYNNTYFTDLKDIKSKAKNDIQSKKKGPTSVKIPKNFPEVRYKVQKNLSNVFDVVPRHLFFEEYSKFNREPAISEINEVKREIIENCFLLKQQLKTYDHDSMRTDPYNIPLVEAGVCLAKGRISMETFIDFAIYIQQYNLPSTKGKYYKVGSFRKEIYLRCLDPSTAKKMFNKKPYCTIEQFLKKPIPICRIEEFHQ